MDVLLEELLQQVKNRVEVLAGENPIMSVADAIRLAERNGLLYRYAQNGGNYEVRWEQSHPPLLYMESELPLLICKKIVQLLPAKKATKPSIALDTETIQTPDTPKTTPKATPKSTSKTTSKSKGQTKPTTKPPK